MSDYTVPKRNRWDFSQYGCPYGRDLLKNKNELVELHTLYMLMRSQEIFTWKGLPDTVPAMELELLLQQGGYAIITDVPQKGIYALFGGLGGTKNAYYRPTVANVANPYLNYSANLEIGKECEVILNDPFYLGLLPLFQINAEQQAETDISLRFAEINSRIEAFLVADTDQAKTDAEKVLEDIEEGRKLGIIGDKSVFDGIKSIAYAGRPAGNLKDLMEMKQYYKSSWFIDMGLNAVFNMKREAINESESQMGVDALLPLIHQMLKQRKEGCERINRLYGLDVSCELSDIWKEAEKDAEREPETETEPETESEEGEKTNEDSRE